MPVTIETRRNRSGQYTPLGDVQPVDPVTAMAVTGVDIGKPQAVRLADIAVFGPLMIYAGMGKKAPRWVQWGLIIVGVGTIIYNLHYYLVNRQLEREGVTDAVEALEGLQVGPWHKVADQRRPGQLRGG
jgi:hypothetical protein